MKILQNILLVGLLILGCFSCTQEAGNTASKSGAATTKTGDKQLNVSIFLDLSSRILPSKENPAPTSRDIEAIKTIVDLFKQDMHTRGAHKAKGKLKVFFSPTPESQEINQLATDLRVNLAEMNPQEKKVVYDDIDSRFSNALARIYNQSLEDKKWIGADIWRFFKKDVLESCILDDYRNILVILTDGYIYHERSKQKEGKRFSYILGPQLQKLGLRKNSNWKELIDKEDIGLLTVTKGLNNLEVLILGICPEENHPEDEDIVEYILSRWMAEMEVAKFKIKSTDLPINTQEDIKRFFASH